MIRQLIGLASARRRVRQLGFALGVADARADRLVAETHRAALEHEKTLGQVEAALDAAERNAREQHGRALAMIESAERSEAVLDLVLDALSQAFNVDRDLSPRELTARCIEEADRIERRANDLGIIRDEWESIARDVLPDFDKHEHSMSRMAWIRNALLSMKQSSAMSGEWYDRFWKLADLTSNARGVERWEGAIEAAEKVREEVDEAKSMRAEIVEACQLIGPGGDGTLKGRVETLLSERHSLHRALHDVARIIGEPGHTESTIVEAVRRRIAKPALKLSAPVCQAEGCVRAAPHSMRVGIADAVNDPASPALFFGTVRVCHDHKDELLGNEPGTSKVQEREMRGNSQCVDIKVASQDRATFTKEVTDLLDAMREEENGGE